MTSFNLLSSHVSSSARSTPSRSSSISALGLAAITPESGSGGGSDYAEDRPGNNNNSSSNSSSNSSAPPPMASSVINETTPLLSQKDLYASGGGSSSTSTRLAKWRSLPRRIAITVWNSIHWVLHTLAAPGVYLIACLCDEQGAFAPLGQLTVLLGLRPPAPPPPVPKSSRRGKGEKKTAAAAAAAAAAAPLAVSSDEDEKMSLQQQQQQQQQQQRRRRVSSDSDAPTTTIVPTDLGRRSASSMSPDRGSTYAVSSESESDLDRQAASGAGGGSAGASAAAGSRRSVRIKLNDDTLRQRKHRKGQASSSSTSAAHGGTGSRSGGSGSGGRSGSLSGGGSGGRTRDGGLAGEGVATKDILAQLKSPTSPAGALTKYPRMPAPPRPLIPRRQPSFLNLEPADKSHQKTLILDLDETLIHSMSKGGRMSTGHMVEVRLNTTFIGMGGQPSAGPQHPILYYVHKRPYCDEFLRRVCKWYNLVVFTASVQEYADPVIDWLESERKYFSARYYRQHCTYRHGAFIKDLSAVEPDLSKVMILDNSPLSYMFHQDNAIPIQGWISDHTDNDLLHLVPLLEGLQYVSDVRALLALRGGEDGRHMA